MLNNGGNIIRCYILKQCYFTIVIADSRWTFSWMDGDYSKRSCASPVVIKSMQAYRSFKKVKYKHFEYRQFKGPKLDYSVVKPEKQKLGNFWSVYSIHFWEHTGFVVLCFFYVTTQRLSIFIKALILYVKWICTY